MISLFPYFCIFFPLVFLFSNRPIKSAILLFLSCVSFFFSLWVSLGSCWFSLIFRILFLGGVIVVILVLSSLMPNEKVEKFSLFLFVFSFFYFFLSVLFFNYRGFSTFFSQICFFRGFNFLFLTFLVTCYFFSFLFVLTFDKGPLRSFFCQILIIL